MPPVFSAFSRSFSHAAQAVKRAFPHLSDVFNTFGFSERRCVACFTPFCFHKGQLPLCPDCLLALQPRQTGYCPLCGEIAEETNAPPALCAGCLKAAPPWHGMRFVGEYRGLLRDLLHRAKYSGDAATLALLGKILAQIACDMPKADVLVPMPLSTSRLRQRGFNQCVEIAKAMVAALPAYTHWSRDNASENTSENTLCKNLPALRVDLLTKHRATPSQTTLTRARRLENLRGVFTAAPQVQGLRILLLDDTSTTGASLREATRTLLRAGALSVQVIFVAHANAFAQHNRLSHTPYSHFLKQNVHPDSLHNSWHTHFALWEKHV